MPLRENRYGLLPDNLINILGNKCLGGYIEDKVCFVRKGIKPNSKQSFLYAIADLFMPTKKVNIKKFKQTLINSPGFTETLFLSLNNGMIAQKFFDKRTSKSAFENSPAIDLRVNNGTNLMANYQISAVPAFVVNSRYKTDLQMAGDQQRLLEILDYLVKKNG